MIYDLNLKKEEKREHMFTGLTGWDGGDAEI